MSDSVILVGMPGVGKSTIGVLLARELGLDFVDTDILIQVKEGKTLQQIVDTEGHEALKEIEERVILSHQFSNMLVATGGSAIYSDAAIKHLKSFGKIIYLQIDVDELKKRLGDISTRGIVAPKGTDILQIARERERLYEKHATLTMNTSGLTLDEALSAILSTLNNYAV